MNVYIFHIFNLIILSALLAGCSPSLGTHEYQSLNYASSLPKTVKHYRTDPGYVSVTILADVSLNGEKWNALYAHASYCPFRETREIIAFGLFSDENEPKKLPLRISHEGPTAYKVYIPTEGQYSNSNKPNSSDFGYYNLLEDKKDICVRIIHTTMPSARYSNVIQIPLAEIKTGQVGED